MKVVVRTVGGLGNQLFQISYGFALSKELGAKLYVDKSLYDNYKVRSFSCDKIPISDLYSDYRSNTDSQDFFYFLLAPSYRVIQKVFRLFYGNRNNHFGGFLYKLLSKSGFYFNFDSYYYDVRNSKSESIFVYGYFQSEKYFYKYLDLVKKSVFHGFNPLLDVKKPLDEICESAYSCAISLRLGEDYLKEPNLSVCNEAFYQEAIAEMIGSNPEVSFFVFSDDISKAKELISNLNFDANFVFIDDYDDVHSLYIMSKCMSFIISNSSFSWWGAYLGEYDNKEIYVPYKWYNKQNVRCDIYIDSMKSIYF